MIEYTEEETSAAIELMEIIDLNDIPPDGIFTLKNSERENNALQVLWERDIIRYHKQMYRAEPQDYRSDKVMSHTVSFSILPRGRELFSFLNL